MSTIRMIKREDIPALKEVLDSIDLFPAEMLDEMIADFLTNSSSQDIWFTTLENGQAISIGYCAPEKLTEGTYNLYAIGVHKSKQGKGLGSSMMHFLENHLQKTGQRVLIVDTSGSETFDLTRKFYEKLDYTKEAVIRDFWAEGDDKVTYYKKLR